MKISSVQPFLLSYRLPEPLKLSYYGGERTIVKRDAMVVRVQADKGLVGYCPAEASEKAFRMIKTLVAPFLEGKTLTDPTTLRRDFEEDVHPGPEVLKAYSAVEIALYDLYGKDVGAPVSELLGGRVRDRIRLYGSAGMYMSPQKYAEEARAISRMGFTGYKMRPGIGPEKDLDAVRLMREAVGQNVELMVDAHTWWRMGDRSYRPETVEQLAKDLAAYRIAWLEEPLPPDDHDAYLRLKEKGYVSLASGEHEPSQASFLDLITRRCVDYVQMDLCCQGGYAAGRHLLSAVSAHGLRFAFHSWGTGLEVIAAAHLGICWPDSVASWLEYPCYSGPTSPGMYPFPLAYEILSEPLVIRNGDLIVSRKPGLGVEVNESIFERYPWVPGPWSYFHLESPNETWAVTSDHSTKWSGRLDSLPS